MSAKLNYIEGFTKRVNMMAIEDALNPQDESYKGKEFSLTYTSDYPTATFIYRDVDDYTIHAVITRYDDHHLMHVLASPCFMELLDELGIRL